MTVVYTTSVVMTLLVLVRTGAVVVLEVFVLVLRVLVDETLELEDGLEVGTELEAE